VRRRLGLWSEDRGRSRPTADCRDPACCSLKRANPDTDDALPRRWARPVRHDGFEVIGPGMAGVYPRRALAKHDGASIGERVRAEPNAGDRT